MEKKLETCFHRRLYNEGEDYDSVVLLNPLHALVVGHLNQLLGLLILCPEVLEEFSIAEEPLPLGDWGKRDVGEGASAAHFPHHQDLPDDEGEEERKNQMKGAHGSGNDPLGGIDEPVSIFKALLTTPLNLRMKQKRF